MNRHTTPKAREAERVYAFIVAYLDDYGIPPHRREIAEGIGMSAHQVDGALARLRGAGRIGERSTLPTVCLMPRR